MERARPIRRDQSDLFRIEYESTSWFPLKRTTSKSDNDYPTAAKVKHDNRGNLSASNPHEVYSAKYHRIFSIIKLTERPSFAFVFGQHPIRHSSKLYPVSEQLERILSVLREFHLLSCPESLGFNPLTMIYRDHANGFRAMLSRSRAPP